jgi:hypothetical protein
VLAEETLGHQLTGAAPFRIGGLQASACATLALAASRELPRSPASRAAAWRKPASAWASAARHSSSSSVSSS